MGRSRYVNTETHNFQKEDGNITCSLASLCSNRAKQQRLSFDVGKIPTERIGYVCAIKQ